MHCTDDELAAKVKPVIAKDMDPLKELKVERRATKFGSLTTCESCLQVAFAAHTDLQLTLASALCACGLSWHSDQRARWWW